MPDFKIPFLGDGITKGDVVKLLVKIGDTVKRDQGLFELETDKAVMEVPSDVDGKITNIMIKPGDKVKPEQAVMQIEASASVAAAPVAADAAKKTDAPKPAPAPSVAAAPVAAERLQKTIAPSQTPPNPPASRGESSNGHVKDDRLLPAGPSVRRFARELGVDLGNVSGSGPQGRITLDDVKLYVRTSAKVPSGGGATVGAIGPQALPDFTKWGATHREPM
ncbi:MAG: E3 binding domain-containing protein, partial [bacterium]|nr:E3 binding domain-containing protein [bacterium]